MLPEWRQCQRHRESGEGGLSHKDHSRNSALTFLSIVLPITENGQPSMCTFTYDIQSVSRLVDITAGGDFLGLCDKKKFQETCV